MEVDILITADFELTKAEADIVYDAIRINVIYSDVIDDPESQIAFEISMFGLYEPLQQVKDGKASNIQLNGYTARHILYSLQDLRDTGNTLYYIIDEQRFKTMCSTIKDLIYRLLGMVYIDKVFGAEGTGLCE
jgi:hypothetical protein